MASIVKDFMASNASSPSTLLSSIANVDSKYIYTGSLLLLTLLVVGFLNLSPEMDPREPPLLKPKIPVIGHIIGLLTEHTALFARL